jgi:hypothetical protein
MTSMRYGGLCNVPNTSGDCILLKRKDDESRRSISEMKCNGTMLRYVRYTAIDDAARF